MTEKVALPMLTVQLFVLKHSIFQIRLTSLLFLRLYLRRGRLTEVHRFINLLHSSKKELSITPKSYKDLQLQVFVAFSKNVHYACSFFALTFKFSLLHNGNFITRSTFKHQFLQKGHLPVG